MIGNKPIRRRRSGPMADSAWRKKRQLDLDPVMRLRKEVEQAGSLRKAAVNIGISPAYLSDLLRHRREPGDKVLKYLGLKKIVHRSVRYEEC